MKIVHLAFALLLVPMLFAEAPATAKDPAPPASTEPLIVDVHPSPYRGVIWYRTNVSHQRFDMRDATILDLISVAYKRQDDGTILGGPTWIDFDRFDVVAKIASLKLPSYSSDPASLQNPQDPYDQIRPVLKRALDERFHLTYHTENRPLPGYSMTVVKDGAKLTEAKDPSAPSDCKYAQDKSNPGQGTLTCTSQTLTEFLSDFGDIFPHPVIDHTGLTKSYDFALKLNFGQIRTRDEYIRAFTDILKQQLGLAVTPETVSQPAIVVDKVDRTPTPNQPDIAKLIPALPDLEFEVATIKPAADNEPPQQIRPTGSQIAFSNWPLQALLVMAWQFPTGAMLGDRPVWLNQVRYSLMVKLPPDIDARNVFQDRDLIDGMLQKLLIDRFQIKYHWGERSADGYALLPGTPKMKKADPNSRSFCKFGPPDGEKAVNGTPDSPFDEEFHCQNVTMDQFADLAQSLANSEIKTRVPNKTGLAGSYDFTLYYTSARKLRADNAAAVEAAKQAGGDATAAPVGGDSIEDAFRKQLGLRLERQTQMFPALILDHIEQTPTEN